MRGYTDATFRRYTAGESLTGSTAMQIKFTLPHHHAMMLRRLACVIAENSTEAPSPSDIAKSLIIELLIDDALAHQADRPRLAS
jgi:hypothetical protein